MVTQPVATFIVDSVKSIALKRPDPYSFNGVLPAQEAVAALLSVWPDLARDWIKEPLPEHEASRRRAIVMQAFSLGRNLTVRDDFGSMTIDLWNDPDTVVRVLEYIDDKYSVADQHAHNQPTAYRLRRPLPVALWPALGVVLTALNVVVAMSIPLEPPQTGPGVLEVLLPLLGIIAAVHLLAIEIASGRLPRLATIAVATSRRILLAYGFLISSVAFSYAGGWLWDFERTEERAWVVLTLLTSFGALAMVVNDLVQAQDARVVARILAQRDRWNAKRAAKEFDGVLQANQEWTRAASNLRNVREVLSVPVARRHSIVSAEHAGVVRLDVRGFLHADRLIDEMLTTEGSRAGHRIEVLLLKKPGVAVSRGESLAAIVADEPRHMRHLEAVIERALSVDAETASTRSADAAVAVSRILGVTVAESEQETSREIVGYLCDMIEASLSSIRLTSEGGSSRTPFRPAIAGALAVERIYRDTLPRNDEFMRASADRAILALAQLSVFYPSSQILEALMTRISILARDSCGTDEVTTVVATWTELGKIAFLGKDRPVRRLIVNEIADLCSKLDRSSATGETTGFCIERYAEMLASAMYADYFSSRDVIRGAKRIADIATQSNQSVTKFTASMCLLEIGAAALEHSRYSIAYRMITIINSAGVDFDSAVSALRRPEISSRMQFKSSLAGEAFGIDVEAAVIQYQTWVHSLKVMPTSVVQEAQSSRLNQ